MLRSPDRSVGPWDVGPKLVRTTEGMDFWGVLPTCCFLPGGFCFEGLWLLWLRFLVFDGLRSWWFGFRWILMARF